MRSGLCYDSGTYHFIGLTFDLRVLHPTTYFMLPQQTSCGSAVYAWSWALCILFLFLATVGASSSLFCIDVTFFYFALFIFFLLCCLYFVFFCFIFISFSFALFVFCVSPTLWVCLFQSSPFSRDRKPTTGYMFTIFYFDWQKHWPDKMEKRFIYSVFSKTLIKWSKQNYLSFEKLLLVVVFEQKCQYDALPTVDYIQMGVCYNAKSNIELTVAVVSF